MKPHLLYVLISIACLICPFEAQADWMSTYYPTLEPAQSAASSIPAGACTFQGHLYSDDVGTLIDNTEGMPAFVDLLVLGVLPLPQQEQPTLLDIGGGKNGCAGQLLRSIGFDYHTFDPYNRTVEQNRLVEALLEDRQIDYITSMSVLNVIPTPDARLAHIQMAYDLVKPGGRVYFKVWSGPPNLRGQSFSEYFDSGGYQSYVYASEYFDEIVSIFGQDAVTVIDDHTFLSHNLLIADKPLP